MSQHEHQSTSGLDAFAALSDEDKNRVRQLHKGSRFTASARNMLAEFAVEHGWSQETLTDVLLLLRS